MTPHDAQLAEKFRTIGDRAFVGDYWVKVGSNDEERAAMRWWLEYLRSEGRTYVAGKGWDRFYIGAGLPLVICALSDKVIITFEESARAAIQADEEVDVLGEAEMRALLPEILKKYRAHKAALRKAKEEGDITSLTGVPTLKSLARPADKRGKKSK